MWCYLQQTNQKATSDRRYQSLFFPPSFYPAQFTKHSDTRWLNLLQEAYHESWSFSSTWHGLPTLLVAVHFSSGIPSGATSYICESRSDAGWLTHHDCVNPSDAAQRHCFTVNFTHFLARRSQSLTHGTKQCDINPFRTHSQIKPVLKMSGMETCKGVRKSIKN